MKTIISYIPTDQESVKKAFNTLMVRYSNDKEQVLTVLNNNTIAVANADLWQSEGQKSISFVELWEVGKWLERGKQCVYSDIVYNIIQSHLVTDSGQTPNLIPALYRPAPFKDPGRDYPKWDSIGLLDSENNWKLNDRVDWSGQYWQSSIDNNVFEPGTPNSQWFVVGTNPNPLPNWQPFPQVYNVNDEVTHNNEDWRNRRANNTFEPGTNDAGWLRISNTPYNWYYLGSEGFPINWIVIHNGFTWMNNLDNNFYEPGVFGWSQI
jgi:hypothetical protein